MMSGQLVGEVIAAADQLQANELPPRAFHALIAIAEKADTHSRTASVRWDHICAGLYGASKRTAERAVDDLVDAGVVAVVAKGFKNRHQSRAPIYKINESLGSDTTVAEAGGLGSDKTGSSFRQNGASSRRSGVVLDVSLDVPIDGRLARVPDVDANPPPRPDSIEPPRRCSKHEDVDDPPPCGGCAEARRANDKWNLHRVQAEQEAANADAAERRRQAAIDSAQAIARCGLCDDDGYRGGGGVCDHVDRTEVAAAGSARVREALAKVRNGSAS